MSVRYAKDKSTVISVLLIFFIIVGVITIVFPSLNYHSSQKESSSRVSGYGQKITQVINYSVSWAIYYPDINSMIKDSDLIVIGTIISYKSYTNGRHGDLVFTDYKIKVEKVLKGPKKDYIIFTQTGGIINGIKYEVNDDPLMKIGEKAVFFLKYDKESDKYFTNPQGRLLIINDKVYSLNIIYPNRNIMLPFSINGMDLNDLIRIIKSKT